MQTISNEARHFENGGYFWIHNEIIDYYVRKAARLGKYVFLVYGFLCRYADNKTQICFPEIRTIAKVLHIGSEKIVAALVFLEKEGLVKIIRSKTIKKHNTYVLLDLPIKVKKKQFNQSESSKCVSGEKPINTNHFSEDDYRQRQLLELAKIRKNRK